MVNKNRSADLFQFFFTVFLVLGGAAAFLWFGWTKIDRNAIKMLDAKISDYVQQQWEAGGK